MSKYPDLFVIRHGQTEWNTLGRFQGRKDSPLTAQGRAQASAIGHKLAEIIGATQAEYTAYASPLGRTQASAALMLAQLDMQPTNDTRLQEIGFGAWEGLSLEDIAKQWPEKAKLAKTEPFLWHFQSPNGETLAEITERCQAFLNDLTGPAIVITHGVTSRILRGLWLGLDEHQMGELSMGQGVIFHLSHGQAHSIDAGNS